VAALIESHAAAWPFWVLGLALVLDHLDLADHHQAPELQRTQLHPLLHVPLQLLAGSPVNGSDKRYAATVAIA